MRFAEELRAWRQVRGWSQAELGAKLGYSGSHVSSVERMERVAVAEFAASCDEALQTPGTFARIHADIAREAYPPWFSPFVHFEATATRVHNWDARSFTGLLQCEEYARALIRAGHPDASDAEVDRDVAARTERQKILDRESPPACWFVIGEAAFRSAFGDDAVMGAQVARVAELAARHHIHGSGLPAGHAGLPGG
jgi:transcriptional regulator with XRE-family HTH domain